MVTSVRLLVSFPSSQKRRSTASLETILRLRSIDRGVRLHCAQYALECFLAQSWRQSARNGSRARALAIPRTVSLLVFCSGFRLGLLRKGKGPRLNGGLVCLDVGRISTHLHASVRLGGQRTVSPALEKMTELSISPPSERQANSCVSVSRFSGKMTELVRLSPSVSGHKRPSKPKPEGLEFCYLP